MDNVEKIIFGFVVGESNVLGVDTRSQLPFLSEQFLHDIPVSLFHAGGLLLKKQKSSERGKKKKTYVPTTHTWLYT